MTPPFLKPPHLAKIKEAGQLSIFLGICLTLIISMLAFIVNVGLFVSARINLQNAVDAAAYAGAAVQARMLTQIAYVNWEMRNNYKEFLFKYYVLGQLGNPRVLSPSGTTMNYRPKPFSVTPGEDTYADSAYDPYNLPSVCIHPGAEHNICAVANVPGVPRFNSAGLPGISEKQEEFLNSIVDTKSRDCTRRSDLNFGTAMIWAYGAGGGKGGVSNAGFEIAGDRVGVFPRAIELAIRVRNLEMLLNRPPESNPICKRGSGCTDVDTLSQVQGNMPLNERPAKAFMSAWRNLSGGYSGSGSKFYDLKNSFKLTEIAPKSVQSAPGSLSGYFINEGFTYPAGSTAMIKHYVDLQLIPVNYLIFYTAFVSTTGQFGSDVQSEGDCAGSKTGIPLPGFPLGFIKNPNVITYYAVKGEANFVGLMYPFNRPEGIKMVAYAAAKPMGGRIGPRLFKTAENTVYPRSDSSGTRSAGYIQGLTISPPWKEGLPIPYSVPFFVQAPGDPIGGIPSSGTDALYGVPNIVYEINGSSDNQLQAGANIQILSRFNGPASAEPGGTPSATEKFGLYDVTQFQALLANAGTLGGAGGNVTAERVRAAIIRARHATNYDVANYLVPAYFDDKNGDIEGPSEVRGTVETIGTGDMLTNYVNWNTFAPLYGEGTLYPNPETDFPPKVADLMQRNGNAIETYLKGLKEVADVIITRSATTRDDNLRNAANLIFPSGKSPTPGSLMLTAASCSGDISMAEKFGTFFNFNVSLPGGVCGIVPIHYNVLNYLKDTSKVDPTMMQAEYALFPTGTDPKTLLSGFMPGERSGASSEGQMLQAFNNQPEQFAKRNYYSVKFVPMKSLQSSGPYFNGTIYAYGENSDMGSQGELKSGSFEDDGHNNSLTTGQLSDFPQLFF